MKFKYYVWGTPYTFDDFTTFTQRLTSDSGLSCIVKGTNEIESDETFVGRTIPRPFFISIPGPDPEGTEGEREKEKEKEKKGDTQDEYMSTLEFEEFLSIPLHGRPWHLESDPSGNIALISIGGHGPAKLPPAAGTIQKLHVDLGRMGWRLHTDATKDLLKISVTPRS